jgi:predicted transcriptional regulator
MRDQGMENMLQHVLDVALTVNTSLKVSQDLRQPEVYIAVHARMRSNGATNIVPFANACG